jgi:hypothetical protein
MAMGALEAIVTLNTSLDEVTRALAAPDADALIAAESRLASALADLAPPSPLAADTRPLVAAEVARARASLARCRILGAALADATRLVLAAQGHAADYGRAGGSAAPPAVDIRGHRLRTSL